MYKQFPLWSSAVKLAHELWGRLVHPHDTLIDATCGNGYDTLFLAKLVPHGKVYGFDVQDQAIANTRQRLIEANMHAHVELLLASHATFPIHILPETVQLIVYNLGYLPGGNKQLTTQVLTTLQSIQNGLPLLKKGGALSLTLYPGHTEGLLEQNALLEFIKTLPPNQWMVQRFQWLNRSASPNLLMLFKQS